MTHKDIPADEEILVRVAVAFESLEQGDTFTIADQDRRMKSLLGAGYLEVVEKPEVDKNDSDGQQVIEFGTVEVVEDTGRGKTGTKRS